MPIPFCKTTKAPVRTGALIYFSGVGHGLGESKQIIR